MERLEAALDWAKSYDVEQIARSVQAIGFECTRCGRCCQGTEAEPHTATVFPDEVRAIQDSTGRSWSGVARPMPYGISDGGGETFEWALQGGNCGDCTFLESDGDRTRCSIYGDRPLLCQTYPFKLSLPVTGGPDASAVASHGKVVASECPGLGGEMSRKRALAIAETLKERAIRELQETRSLRENYRPRPDLSGVVVHDSEGRKRPDGRPVEAAERDNY